jgi:hypothetical protein
VAENDEDWITLTECEYAIVGCTNIGMNRWAVIRSELTPEWGTVNLDTAFNNLVEKYKLYRYNKVKDKLIEN